MPRPKSDPISLEVNRRAMEAREAEIARALRDRETAQLKRNIATLRRGDEDRALRRYSTYGPPTPPREVYGPPRPQRSFLVPYVPDPRTKRFNADAIRERILMDATLEKFTKRDQKKLALLMKNLGLFAAKKINPLMDLADILDWLSNLPVFTGNLPQAARPGTFSKIWDGGCYGSPMVFNVYPMSNPTGTTVRCLGGQSSTSYFTTWAEAVQFSYASGNRGILEGRQTSATRFTPAIHYHRPVSFTPPTVTRVHVPALRGAALDPNLARRFTPNRGGMVANPAPAPAPAPVWRNKDLSGPPSTPRGPHVRSRPAPRDREGKAMTSKLGGAIAGMIDAISEGAEAVDAVYQALPPDVRKRWEAGRDLDRPADQYGQYGLEGADWKLWAIYHNIHRLDVSAAITNLLLNQVEDRIVGAVARAREDIRPRNLRKAIRRRKRK